VRLARVDDPAGGVAVARLDDTGAAAIAWAGNLLTRVQIATRPGVGGFRAPVTVAQGEPLPADFDPFWFSPAFAELGGSYASESLQLFGRALALTADGRALLAVTSRRGEAYVARLATVPLAGPGAAGASAGGQFDTPLLAQALELADGTPALTWITDVQENHLTLHLATEGGNRPTADAVPRVRFGAPVRRVLDYDDSLRLPFRCSGPCSVRARIVGQEGSDGVVTRYRAGRGVLRISSPEPIVGRGGPRPVRVRVSYGAPGAVKPRSETVTVRLERSSRPEPRIAGLRAVRRGNAVRVTFRVQHAPEFAIAVASGSRTRDDRGNPLVLTPEAIERGRRNPYRLTLRPADGVRYVTLRTLGDSSLQARQTVRVR
jgi:hypothetical protein